MNQACTLLALVVALSLVLAGPGAQATTYYVDPGGSGQSLTIQHAVNISLDGDTILVAAGTYGENVTIGGKVLVVVSESGPEVTIIDAYNAIQILSRGFYIYLYGGADGLVIDGFTIINGAAQGIRIDDAGPTIHNCVITGNDSSMTDVSANGGGIVMGGSGTTIIQNCTITDNHRRGAGAGLYAYDCDSLILEGCVVSGNGASGSGGGIYLENTPATITTCTISDNHTVEWGSNGGGICAEECSDLLIQNCVVSGNRADYWGGGIYLSLSVATIFDCTISGNHADVSGGGIYGSISVLVDACSIIDNTAHSAAGASFQHRTTVRHCNILGNEASWTTGGLYAGHTMSFDSIIVENCTVAYNLAPFSGAGVTAGGSNTHIDNTIIAFNDGYGLWTADAMTRVSCCDVYGNSGDNYFGYLPDQTGINDNISEDPLFCVQPSYDTFIYSASPCAAGNSPCGTLIGRSGVACTSLPDLVVASAEFDDHYPPVGGSIQATVKIKNVGHITAYGFFTGYYYDLLTPPVTGQSGNVFFYTDSLAAGDSLTHWISGISNDEIEEWCSYFQVDYTGAVQELTEGDNVSGPYTIDWTIPPTDGWPIAGGGDFRSSPVIALLDNDPRTKEVVIGCDDGYLYAFSAYGTVLPGQWPVDLGSPVSSSPAAGNIAGTYHNEIVVGCGAFLYAFDWAGTQLWRFGPSMAVNSTPALADLDGDGELEIVFSRESLLGDIQLYALEGDGTVFPGSWPVLLTGNAATSPAVGDMDQDGDIEIAVVSSGISKTGDSSLVYLFNSDGTYFSIDWPVLLDTIVTCSPVMGNLTADPKLELITGGMNGTIYAVNLTGSIWPSLTRLQGSIDMSLALAQLDADDQQEIIAASRYWDGTPAPGFYRGFVTAIDNDGSIIPGWPLEAGTWITGLTMPSPVAFSGTVLDGSPVGNVYGWAVSADAATGFPLDVEGRVYSSLAVGDLDGDGCLDMIAATSSDSVYAFDLGAVEDIETPGHLCWPFYRNDRTRSGCYFVDPVTDAGEPENILPAATALRSIHPNPFNPATTITFDIIKRTHVRVSVHDAAGRTVCILTDSVVDKGRHEVVWKGKTGGGESVASGIYFCRLAAGGKAFSRKMVLLR